MIYFNLLRITLFKDQILILDKFIKVKNIPIDEKDD